LIQPKYVASWMSYIRNHPEDKRFLECFWDSQMRSKTWLIEEINKVCPAPKNIMIFGGWYGVLAQMFESNFPSLEKIISLDVDLKCAIIANEIKLLDIDKISLRTMCMTKYKYREEFDFVVNTSAEHVEQSVYDNWWEKIPSNTLVAVQSNNFDSIEEHIRCSDSMENFLKINHIESPIYSGEIDCGGFSRYMAIFRK